MLYTVTSGRPYVSARVCRRSICVFFESQPIAGMIGFAASFVSTFFRAPSYGAPRGTKTSRSNQIASGLGPREVRLCAHLLRSSHLCVVDTPTQPGRLRPSLSLPRLAQQTGRHACSLRTGTPQLFRPTRDPHCDSVGDGLPRPAGTHAHPPHPPEELCLVPRCHLFAPLSGRAS